MRRGPILRYLSGQLADPADARGGTTTTEQNEPAISVSAVSAVSAAQESAPVAAVESGVGLTTQSELSRTRWTCDFLVPPVHHAGRRVMQPVLPDVARPVLSGLLRKGGGDDQFAHFSEAKAESF